MAICNDAPQMLLNRSEIKDLNEWAGRSGRKPLVIRGARQVGKSTMVRQWAVGAQLALLEVNFERNPEFREAFATQSPAQILSTLQLLTAQAIRAGETLLFLDEIQSAPEALAALRYFYEEMPQLHVIAAGSLLEFALADARFSMPVGRVEYMYLGPMQFEDYLVAMEQSALVTWLRNVSLQELRGGAMVRAVHEKYMTLLRQYWVVGGLPEAIMSFVQQRDFKEIGRIHQGIVATYRDDFGKYSHGALKVRVQLVFDKLPSMVGRKFKYSQVSPEHRAAELATALRQLCMARVAYEVHHTSANGVPLGAEANDRVFKTLYMDVGLMCAALHLSLLDLSREDLSLVNDGAIAEQFIGQHLLYSGAPYEAPTLHYWMREARNAAAEIDYVITQGQQIIPVEIKAGKTGTLRSLQVFLKEKRRTFALRFNGDVPSLVKAALRMDGGQEQGYELLSLPLYMVGQTRRLLTENAALDKD
jgi:predicted AAA+ superfamily ATPase